MTKVQLPYLSILWLAKCAIGLASKLPSGSENQIDVLVSAKKVCGSAAYFAHGARDAANSKNVDFQGLAANLENQIYVLNGVLQIIGGGRGALEASVYHIDRARIAVSYYICSFAKNFYMHSFNAVRETLVNILL